MIGPSATAFAPATVANVSVGFDILGFAIAGVGDRVTVEKKKTRDVSVSTPDGFPSDPAKNTATAGLLKLIADRDLPYGFRVSVQKGIPLSSGMGGSAASAVAGILAANALLEEKLSTVDLLKYALVGESVASGAVHGDNVAPCLLGGLILIQSVDPIETITLPSPNLICVLVHPDLEVSTREARKLLKSEIKLSTHVKQATQLAGFVAGCFSGNLALLTRSFGDYVIEPQRAGLIQGFPAVKSAALGAGAVGCSISGSGPSVFAWAEKNKAGSVCEAMVCAFKKSGVAKTQSWISSMPSPGARIVD